MKGDNVTMQQTGIVKEVRSDKSNRADVEIMRSTACGDSCASCGLCPGQKTCVTAINDVNAAAGDTVIITLSDKKVLGAAFLVYIVPLIMLITGYFISYTVFRTEIISIVSGFSLMAVTFPVIMIMDKAMKSHYTPQIISIISHDGL